MASAMRGHWRECKRSRSSSRAGSGRTCPTGFALAGGISYDARITRFCSFSPEFFYTWHQVPNATAYADDVSSVYGLRLSLTWYLH